MSREAFKALVSAVATENELERLVKEEPRDRFLSSYTAQTAEEHCAILRAIALVLQQGEDVELRYDAHPDAGLTEELETVANYMNAEINSGSSHIRISHVRPVRRAQYVLSERPEVLGTTAELAANLGDTFGVYIPEKLREEVAGFLDRNGILRLDMVGATSRKGKRSMAEYRLFFRKEFGIYGRKQFLEVTSNDSTITVRNRISKRKFDMRPYEIIGATPGRFRIEQRHLDLFRPRDLSSGDLGCFSEIQNFNTLNAALLMAYTHLRKRLLRDASFDIGALRHYDDDLGERLVGEYDRRVSNLSARAEEAVSAHLKRDMVIYAAVDRIREEDRAAYAKIMSKGKSGNINGTIGEMVALALMEEIIDKTRGMVAVRGLPGDRKKFSRTPFYIKYKPCGSCVIVDPDLGDEMDRCELDGLLLYKQTIPVIFEAKTGRAKAEGREQKMKRKFVSRLYGVRPLFVRVKVGESPSYEHDNGTFSLTIPQIKTIRAERDRIVDYVRGFTRT